MFRTKDITIVAIFAAILFVQEQVFSFLPNIQLTVFFLVLYSKVFGFKKTIIIVIIHTLLDNLVMGSMNFLYFPFMLIGWLVIPCTVCSLLKNNDNNIVLALFGILFSFIYSWLFIIPNVIINEVSVIAYLSADIVWEIVLAMSSFLTILWLYKPCSKIIQKAIEDKE